MFWKQKPTIDSDDLDWQIETWAWLLKNLGGIDAMRDYPIAAPHHTQFPPSDLVGEEHAAFVFQQVAKRFRIDPSTFDLVAQEEEIKPVLGPLAVVQNTPTGPLGTYSNPDMDKHVVSYSPALLDNLEGLIATFAHEICHPILLAIEEKPPGGYELEEFATDLAMVFHGFGIFGANGAFSFAQYSDVATGTQGWSYSGAGYLTQAEWGFALAVRTILTGSDAKIIEYFLTDGPKAHFRKNLRYLRSSNVDLVSLNGNHRSRPCHIQR